MDTRARFEEIWPVPEGVYWSPRDGRYIATSKATDLIISEYNARQDTFARCQETAAIHMSLIDEMVFQLKQIADLVEADMADYADVRRCRAVTIRAKLIMEQKK